MACYNPTSTAPKSDEAQAVGPGMRPAHSMDPPRGGRRPDYWLWAYRWWLSSDPDSAWQRAIGRRGVHDEEDGLMGTVLEFLVGSGLAFGEYDGQGLRVWEEGNCELTRISWDLRHG